MRRGSGSRCRCEGALAFSRRWFRGARFPRVGRCQCHEANGTESREICGNRIRRVPRIALAHRYRSVRYTRYTRSSQTPKHSGGKHRRIKLGNISYLVICRAARGLACGPVCGNRVVMRVTVMRQGSAPNAQLARAEGVHAASRLLKRALSLKVASQPSFEADTPAKT